MIELMNFSEAFELASYQILDDAGVPCMVTQADGVLPDLVAYARFEPGMAEDEMTDPDMPQPGEYSRYTGGTLSVVLYSPRADQEALGTDTQTRMGEIAARIRTLFRFSQMPFEDLLPHYDVCRLRPSGESYSTNDQRQLDMLTMRWALDFTINPDAWPLPED
jgi:hypothetical protein